jgi:hypothetical protein
LTKLGEQDKLEEFSHDDACRCEACLLKAIERMIQIGWIHEDEKTGALTFTEEGKKLDKIFTEEDEKLGKKGPHKHEY